MFGVIGIAYQIFVTLVGSFMISNGPDWLCIAVSHVPGAIEQPWIGYPQGWEDYPVNPDTWIFIPMMQPWDMGLNIQYDASHSRFWLIGIKDMEYMTDIWGEHGGQHELCPVYTVDHP